MTPVEINRRLEHPGLIRDSYVAEFFDKNMIREPERYSRHELNEMIRDMAIAHLEETQGTYPENEFRYYSKLSREHDHYFYEIVLTDLGARMWKIKQAQQCCDDHGYLDIEATKAFWFWRIGSYSLMDGLAAPDKTLPWFAEEWAQPIRQAVEWHNSGRAITSEGQLDMDKTILFWTKCRGYWSNVLTNRPISRPKKGLTVKDYFLALDDEWAKPIQEAIVHYALRT